uniref:Protein FAM228B n=1 Tax=Monopterus albus TaxID=43700 RepID=A0A3Q3K3P7_MONAL
MEAENQQARKIAETLQDTENGFMKELERFLSRWDETELRRRELLHKHWTERVWFPLQSRVEAHVSSCGPAEAKRRLSLYSDYLHHCNTKGYVFLDTYDLKDYNPFLLNIKKPHFSKLRTNDTKDPLYLQLHQRPPEKRTACSYDAEYTRRHVEKLPQNDRHLTDSVMPQADTPLLTSSNYLASPSTNTPVKDETGGRKSSRLDTIPHNGNAAPDGRCHCTGSCFSRCGCRE